ncbi:class I SAM-dependent methyltransferase [Longimicrobium sp.]|uniref:class I SAM-dependent methyltransferase n=1 Tax=Longimicrobium sp. TaxID=2029185 RepID=UPI002CC3BCCE|nr:class I SAM-dependent methyltransferase [Longimicrobium sp.]HSU17470.1 class I SAM-dependent methyltransferase [Longimicrobium sp.]
MPEPARFDADSVRAAWDRAADGYAASQEAGLDYYRYEFLGPAQVAACGDVRGLRVLDVGCGSGYLAREMATRGARAEGVDISPRMIEHARRHEARSPLGIAYHAGDAAEVASLFAAESFDLAVSCIALQDMPDPAAVLRGVFSVLRPGGRFVASISHPCSETPFRRWERDEAGGKRWLCIDRYFERGPVEFQWERWGGFTTAMLHVPLEDWFQWIVAAGFHLRAVREPRPTDDAVRANPKLADAARVPYYVIFDLQRPG